jgi:hypothetical protein
VGLEVPAPPLLNWTRLVFQLHQHREVPLESFDVVELLRWIKRSRSGGKITLTPTCLEATPFVRDRCAVCNQVGGIYYNKVVHRAINVHVMRFFKSYN